MGKTIFARDYGIFPDRYKNSLADINKMIDSIECSDEEVTIVFDAGRYILSHEECITREINISNTTSSKEYRNKTRNIGILFQNKRNIIVEGNGAFFTINGMMIIIMMEACKNIVIKNVSFDYIRPTVSELTVDKVSMTSMDCSVHNDSTYRIEDDAFVVTGANFEDRKPYHTLVYDVEENRTFRLSHSPFKSANSVKETAPYKIRITNTIPRVLEQGAKVGQILEVRNTIKNAVGVFMVKSRDITFSGVAFHYMHGLGIVGQLSKNLTFDNIVCAPRRQTARHNAAFSDMMHFAMCNGKITIKNSRFSGAGADAINVHGSYLIVKQKLSNKRLLLEFAEPATFGIDAFKEGDDIEAIDTLTYSLQWANKVKSVKVVDKKHLILDLVTPFDGVKVGQAVENVTKTPEVEIVGNTFDNVPSRALLITTRRKVVIKRNVFDNIADSAIYISGDTSKWYESGKVMDVTIEKNTFNKCGFYSGKAVIDIAPKNIVPALRSPVHKNIKIVDNTFVLEKTNAISAKCTQDIVLSNNRYEGNHGGKAVYKMYACSNIIVEREDYTTGKSKMSCTLMDKKKEVTIR